MNRLLASTAALSALTLVILPALPVRAAQDTTAAVAPEASPAVVQRDHEFLQRLESHMPDAPPVAAPSAPDAPVHAETRPVAPTAIAEERAPATRTVTSVTPAPVVTRTPRTTAVRRETVATTTPDVPVTRTRDIEPRRDVVTRPTRIVTAGRSQPAELSDDAAIASETGPFVRTPRQYVIEQPPVVERRAVYPAEDIAPVGPDNDYVEIRTRHHGFFHRLFHRHD